MHEVRRERRGGDFDRLAEAPMPILQALKGEMTDQERLFLAQRRTKLMAANTGGGPSVIPNDLSDWVRPNNAAAEALEEATRAARILHVDGERPPTVHTTNIAPPDPGESDRIDKRAEGLALNFITFLKSAPPKAPDTKTE